MPNKRPLPPASRLPEMLAQGRLRQLLREHNWDAAESAHIAAMTTHLADLEGDPFFNAIGTLAAAAAAGHPYARDIALRSLAGRPPGPEVPYSKSMMQRAHDVDLDALTPTEQTLALKRPEPFPKLARTEFVVAPLGFDFPALLGAGVRSRPVLGGDVQRALREEDEPPRQPAAG